MAAIAPGDPAPHFTQRSSTAPRFSFDSAAGRYLVLLFFPSSTDALARRALDQIVARPDLFDDGVASFFGVTADPADEAEGRLQARIPGYRYFWDADRSVGRLYGVSADGTGEYGRLWVLIDPTLRVIDAAPVTGADAGIGGLLSRLDRLPPPARFGGIELQAPILFLPRVFEPELCGRLIALYDQTGGEVSGVMRSDGDKTVGVHDTRQKSRRDAIVTDEALIRTIQGRIVRRVVPEIAKVHQFHATRMERYIVGCYAADEGGHFAPHRDNTTPGTAHRRFAVSVNLNDDFEGGEVGFPEYGPRTFKAPAGGAVVFSCSLLHAVSRVTRGRRYAFLPFLYDDAAARVRAANQTSLAG